MVFLQQRDLGPIQSEKTFLLIIGNTDILHHSLIQPFAVSLNGRQLTIPLDTASSAQWPTIDTSDVRSLFEHTIERVYIGHAGAEDSYLDAAPLQKGNALLVDEIPVFRDLARDIPVKHDLAIDRLIQRLIVFQGQQNSSQTVLSKGAGGNVL